jgi:hypothetical protein
MSKSKPRELKSRKAHELLGLRQNGKWDEMEGEWPHKGGALAKEKAHA